MAAKLTLATSIHTLPHQTPTTLYHSIFPLHFLSPIRHGNFLLVRKTPVRHRDRPCRFIQSLHTPCQRFWHSAVTEALQCQFLRITILPGCSTCRTRLAPYGRRSRLGGPMSLSAASIMPPPPLLGLYGLPGGQKADQSGISFRECWQFQPTAPPSAPASFNLVNADWPDLVGHRTLLLANGTLLLLGGYSPSLNSLLPFSELWLIDTTVTSPTWRSVIVQGTVPTPRRGFAAVLLDGGKLLIHGGADAPMQTVYSDGAILDLTSMSWSTAEGMSSVLGPRHEHLAVGLGSQVMFDFGM